MFASLTHARGEGGLREEWLTRTLAEQLSDELAVVNDATVLLERVVES